MKWRSVFASARSLASLGRAGKLGAALCGLSMAMAAAKEARAGGLYFSDRGVRPMGRAGAFVAGADDLGAVWYNPAGIADAGSAFLVDFTQINFEAQYTRQLLVLDAENNYQRFNSPTVNGSTPILPLPTIAGSYAFGARKEWTIAAAVLAPYVALESFPPTVNGQPSPARYAMGGFSGSLMAIPGVWAAYKPVEELRIGFGVMALVGSFATTVTFNANPQDRLLGAPEQPEFDANAQIEIGPIFAPAVTGGITYVPSKFIRFGVSAQSPMIVSADGTLTMTMPTSSLFDNAHQDGNSIHMRFVLPAIIRAGIEIRPTKDLRVEFAYVRELWSEEQSIDITPHNLSIDGVTGMAPKTIIPPISFPRDFQDSNSFRLGGEYSFIAWGIPLDARAGVAYETSAVPTPYLSLSSLDLANFTMSFGGSLHVGKRWRFDGMWSHVFTQTTYVNPTTAQIPRINPIKGNAPLEPVNGGWYSGGGDLFGVGLNYLF